MTQATTEYTRTVSWEGTNFEIALTPVDEPHNADNLMDAHAWFAVRCRVAGSPTWREREAPFSRHVEGETDLSDEELFFSVAEDFIHNAEAWETPERPAGEGIEDFPVWGVDSVSRTATGHHRTDVDPAAVPLEEEDAGVVVFERKPDAQ